MSRNPQPQEWLTLDAASSPPRLYATGEWTLAHYASLQKAVSDMTASITADVEFDYNGLRSLDTSGAFLLSKLLRTSSASDVAGIGQSLPSAKRNLLRAVAATATGDRAIDSQHQSHTVTNVLERVGMTMVTIQHQQIRLLGFVGLTLERLFYTMWHPRRWRVTSLVSHMEQTGLNAVPIVALLTFMVGAVVAFLGSTVLADFGATVYTVDLVAFSFLREFAVLLTAILMGGRTASAFTAQIGSMKANEEIDAIRAIGLDPMELLVLPRVLAMLASLPMLTFLAMIAGLTGGGLVCALTLDIPPVMFVNLIKSDVGVRHFLVGIAKAPAFAFLIAVIGCLEGFKVSGSAESVGEHTTSSVVQSIFVVILLDALAALFYMEMGW
ncbi:ABC transporter permease [Dyella sp. EPa41]|uniref:MlaE family ABC transporter permease n=1 Tax=Dyella sp. EPa41 TaxID=1561194 RepID=UPI001915590B|nr:ABC transporter permease [Dyella sp. EPa41]